jgi:hypothetical protein
MSCPVGRGRSHKWSWEGGGRSHQWSQGCGRDPMSGGIKIRHRMRSIGTSHKM